MAAACWLYGADADLLLPARQAMAARSIHRPGFYLGFSVRDYRYICRYFPEENLYGSEPVQAGTGSQPETLAHPHRYDTTRHHRPGDHPSVPASHHAVYQQPA